LETCNWDHWLDVPIPEEKKWDTESRCQRKNLLKPSTNSVCNGLS